MPIYELGTLSPVYPEADHYWVAPDAQVIGQVNIGRDVGIWFGAAIRGDNEPIKIGEGTNIQEGVIIHVDPGYPVTIGKGCTIGHGAIVHGCTLGENTLIGMGATVLNGAVIGKNSLVGAGALVTEGKVFPNNSLIVGAPAKAIRTLDEAAATSLKATAVKYVENMRRFKSELVRVD